MPADVQDQAFVTLATNDTYALGALVLGHSLRQTGTTRRLALLITSGVSASMRETLDQVFNLVHEVDVLDSRDTANLALLTRPDLGVTFTKLHCWRLTQFTKCVFLDADTLVLQNIDDLFEREELSAAPDPGWPDCFNSGVFVYRPSESTYNALLQFALTHGSFDGGDQGLLNLYFRDWATKDIAKHLPFTYNVVSQSFYSYLPAFKQFGKDTKVVHFIGGQKPWHLTYNVSTGQVQGQAQSQSHGQEMLQSWWSLFLDKVQPSLQPGVVGLEGDLASLSIGATASAEPGVNDRMRQLSWERGQIDYKGVDAFDNIRKKLDQQLSTKSAEPFSFAGSGNGKPTS